MSFVLLPNLKISALASPSAAAAPATGSTLWVKADDLDGSSNTTLAVNQALTGVINHGTAFDFEASTNPPTYSQAVLSGSSNYYDIESIFFDGDANNQLQMESPGVLSDIIQNDTWEVFAAARSNNFRTPGTEQNIARLIGDGTGFRWGINSVNVSGDKWSGNANDGNYTYVRADGLEGVNQIVRYRGEDVAGTVKQYMKVDDGTEQTTDMPNPIAALTGRPDIGYQAGGGSNAYIGNIYEIIVYDRVLTEQERSDTYDYLYEKWINVAALPFPDPDFTSPTNSATASFEYPDWPTGSA